MANNFMYVVHENWSGTDYFYRDPNKAVRFMDEQVHTNSQFMSHYSIRKEYLDERFSFEDDFE